jgi:hypothetical protein
MSKRKGRPKAGPIMPSFTAQHYSELRLLLGSVMQQFIDGLDTSKVHFDKTGLEQFERQAQYYRAGIAVLRDLSYQIDTDQKRHGKRDGAQSDATGRHAGGGKQSVRGLASGSGPVG